MNKQPVSSAKSFKDDINPGQNSNLSCGTSLDTYSQFNKPGQIYSCYKPRLISMNKKTYINVCKPISFCH